MGCGDMGAWGMGTWVHGVWGHGCMGVWGHGCMGCGNMGACNFSFNIRTGNQMLVTSSTTRLARK